MSCQICDKGQIELCTPEDNSRLVGVEIEFGRVGVCMNPECRVRVVTGTPGSVFTQGNGYVGVRSGGTLCPVGNLADRTKDQQATVECQHDRHSAITLVAGQGGGGGELFCLRGGVTVCGVCRKFMSGEEGSEYLHGLAYIEVVKGGCSYKRTLRRVVDLTESGLVAF